MRRRRARTGVPDLPAGLSRTLVDWYRSNRRDLPWRSTHDPYRIWVSEVMLQQTTVRVVVPYYERFLERFPTVRALAEAPQDDVLALWSGLGYYRRARDLKAAAEAIVADHGGRFPDDARAVRALPGIGSYTAGAILSIAFGRREAVLDGNVARVLARLFALPGDPRKPPLAATLRELAARLVPAEAPGDHNQALMELGATVCRPSSPECGPCPVRRWCRAHLQGRVAELPGTPPRPKPTRIRVGLVLVESRGRLLMVRRCTGRLLVGLWELPGAELGPEDDPRTVLATRLAGELGLEVEIGSAVVTVSHAITTRRITATTFRATLLGRPRRGGDLSWIARRELPARGVSGLTRKVLAAIGPCGRPARARA